MDHSTPSNIPQTSSREPVRLEKGRREKKNDVSSPLNRDEQTFPVEGEVVNILGFVSLKVFCSNYSTLPLW